MSLHKFLIFSFLASFAWCQVPPQDECQAVDANEPPQCPKTIGPPCPPCIINTESDYTSGDSLEFTSDEIDEITERMNENIAYWYNQMPPDVIYPDNNPYGYYTGASGRSFLFLRLYYYTKNSSYLTMSQEYLETALKLTTNKSFTGESSFFFGNTGVFTIASVVYDVLGDSSSSEMYRNRVVSAFTDVYDSLMMNLSMSSVYGYNLEDGSLITGLSGLLYCGMFINNYFDDNTIIPASQINLIATAIVNIGIATAAQYNYDTLLLYNMPFGDEQCVVPGAAEGISGVIKILLDTYAEGYNLDLFNNYYINIRDTLNFIIDNTLPDGNIPTYFTNGALIGTCESVYGNDTDARVQWCHGAPGYIGTFSKAALVFSDINETDSMNYLQASLSVSDVTWNRGLIIKGLMQCHGIGGNSYKLLHIFRNYQTLSNNIIINGNNIEYYRNQSIYRTQQFIRWTLTQQNIDALRTQYSDEDYSIWAGSYGIPMLYIEALQNGYYNGNTNICMTGWDLCFW